MFLALEFSSLQSSIITSEIDRSSSRRTADQPCSSPDCAADLGRRIVSVYAVVEEGRGSMLEAARHSPHLVWEQCHHFRLGDQIARIVFARRLRRWICRGDRERLAALLVSCRRISQGHCAWNDTSYKYGSLIRAHDFCLPIIAYERVPYLLAWRVLVVFRYDEKRRVPPTHAIGLFISIHEIFKVILSIASV